jgi:hypothetical protein
MKRLQSGGLFGFVGFENQFQELRFFGFELFLLLFFAEVGIDADEVLAFVTSEVENLKGAIGLAGFLALALNADQALARRPRSSMLNRLGASFTFSVRGASTCSMT